MHLHVHLPNGQRVYFNENNMREKAINPPKTTLTAFFDLCAKDNFAENLLYNEVPSYYTFDNTKRIFKRRKNGAIVEGFPEIRKSDMIGRVYTVHLRNMECFCLRILLHKIRGPTSFDFLKTVDGIICESFQEACLQLGFLENDQQWHETLKEATETDSPEKIRACFAIMISCCQLSNPIALWNSHKEAMTEDILYTARQSDPSIDFTPEIFNKSLILVENKVIDMTGKTLTCFGMESPNRDEVNTYDSTRDLQRERNYDITQLNEYIKKTEPLLNADQKAVYNEVLKKHEAGSNGILFIDAPGGTGKTFLLNLILAKIRAKKKLH